MFDDVGPSGGKEKLHYTRPKAPAKTPKKKKKRGSASSGGQSEVLHSSTVTLYK